MSATAADTTGRRSLQSTRPRLAYCLFAFCSSLFLLPLMRTLFIRSDEGIFLDGAARIIHGQVFARDFFEIIGPGSFYWVATFFKLFGVTFFAARLSLFVPLLGTAITIYLLSRKVCARYQAIPCLLLAGPYFGLLGQVESHHVDSNFFALLAVACVVFWQSTRRNSLLFLAGALAGATTCVLQPKGALLLFAIFVWLLFQRREPKSILFQMSLAAGGFAAVVALMLAYFSSRGALHSLYYADVVFPSQSYGAANVVPYAQGIHEIWAFFVSQPGGLKWPVEIAAILIAPALFIAALPALLLILVVTYKWRAITPEVLLYWLCGSALWLSEFHRRDIHHLAYGSPLLIIVCIHMLSQMRIKVVHISVMSLAACALCLAAFNSLVAVAVPAIPTSVGSAAVFGEGSVPVLNFLNSHLRPAEDSFVYPCSPVYYFLSGATNPTPFSCLFYGQNTPAQFHTVIDTLEQHQVRYVVWDTLLLPSLASEGAMQGSTPTSPDQLILESYLQSHYTVVDDAKGILVMERKRP
jgi:hypothetical protein